jgi:hypothetical protein
MEREVSEVDRKLILKKTYLDRIYYHLTRNPIGQDELYTLVRKFFGEYLKLDYEFTYEELSQELNKIFIRPKVKEHIDEFLVRLSESEYLEESSLDTNSINMFLKELDEIIRNMIFEDKSAQAEESLIQKVLKMKGKESHGALDVASVSALIEELNFHISNGSMETAKTYYVNLMKAYDALGRNDKKKLHDAMNESYERLQTLIKNPHPQKPVKREDLSSALKYAKDLIDETTFYINASNLASAKASYSETLKAYESLNPDDRKLLHSDVNELYMQLQGMSSRPEKIDAQVRLLSKTIDEEHNEEPIQSIPVKSVVKPIIKSEVLAEIKKRMESEIPIGVIAQSVVKDISAEKQTGIAGIDIIQESTPEFKNVEGNMMFQPSVSAAGTANTAGSGTSSVANTKGMLDKVDNILGKVDNNIAGTSPNVSLTSSVSTDKGMDGKKIENSVNSAFSLKTESSQPAINPDNNNMLFTVGAPVIESAIKLSDKSSDTSSDKSDKLFDKSSDKLFDKSSDKSSDYTDTARKSGVSPPEKILSQEKAITPDKLVSGVNILEDNKSIKDRDIKNVKKSDKALVKDNVDYDNNISHNINAPSDVHDGAKDIIKIEAERVSQATADKLERLLNKITADILLEKFEAAKESYKDALIIYRKMDDTQKSKCYTKFYSTFKKLDEVLHQKSLRELLDNHMSGIRTSKRVITTDVTSPEPTHEESLKASKTSMLSTSMNIDEHVTRVNELIDESHFSINNRHPDLAMLKYFKALEIYRALPVEDKKRVYPGLRELFEKLSPAKVTR